VIIENEKSNGPGEKEAGKTFALPAP
jgi:hypothetical protein